MTNYIDRGELRFSPPSVFNHMQEGIDKIADKYEGSLYYPVRDFYIAPLLSTDENGKDVYGKPIKIADEAQQRITNPKVQRVPFHCLYCYNNPPMNAVIRLDNYDQIAHEFPDYDTAVIIYKPLEFLRLLEQKFEIYCNYVKYTDRTPLESELDNGIHYLFYKRKIYEEQKEFRIALPKLQLDQAQNFEFGSLLDVAYCVPLETLKYGIIIADGEENFQKIKAKCEEKNWGVSDLQHFFDIRDAQ